MGYLRVCGLGRAAQPGPGPDRDGSPCCGPDRQVGPGVTDIIKLLLAKMFGQELGLGPAFQICLLYTSDAADE